MELVVWRGRQTGEDGKLTKERVLRVLWGKAGWVQGAEWWVWLSVQGAQSGVSLQRSSDLNVPGSEANTAEPSEQGHLWKPGV